MLVCPIYFVILRVYILYINETVTKILQRFECAPFKLVASILVFNANSCFFLQQYECLVEGCGLKFKNYKGRQQHLVDKHKFPSSFEFFKKAHLSKKARQKQHRKQAIHRSEETSSKMDIEGETIDGLVSAVSKLSTSDSSPSSISFGRRNTRGLTFVPRAVQREKRADSVPTGGKQ